jgi:hypothetical protein
VRNVFSATLQTAGYVLLTGTAVWMLIRFVP